MWVMIKISNVVKNIVTVHAERNHKSAILILRYRARTAKPANFAFFFSLRGCGWLYRASISKLLETFASSMAALRTHPCRRMYGRLNGGICGKYTANFAAKTFLLCRQFLKIREYRRKDAHNRVCPDPTTPSHEPLVALFTTQPKRRRI